MPENLTDYEERRLLDLSVVAGDYVALLAVAGTDSALGTEVAGGTYGRAAASFAAATTDSGVSTRKSSAPHLFLDMPAGEVQGWAILSAVSAGDRKWHGLFQEKVVAAAATGDTLTFTAHGWVDDQKVVFQSGYTPAGLAANTTYFVVGATANTFQVAATLGGAALDITADMANAVVGAVATANAGEVFAIPTDSLVLSLA